MEKIAHPWDPFWLTIYRQGLRCYKEKIGLDSYSLLDEILNCFYLIFGLFSTLSIHCELLLRILEYFGTSEYFQS